MVDDKVSVLPIDLGYMGLPEAAAAFLVTNHDSICLVESGPAICFETLTSQLGKEGISIGDLDGLVLTHIHLDHAGASGLLTTDRCPVHVHPRGARHLIDPERLNASAYRVFGSLLDSELGAMVPNERHRVREALDESTVNIGSFTFTAIETPGHARHHHAWLLDCGPTTHLFCGDAAGMRIPGTRFPTIPMVPPEFDPEAWLGSLDRIESTGADTLWLTHFGSTTIASGFLDDVRKELKAEIEFLTRMITHSDTHLPDEHRAWHEARARGYGVSPDMLRRYCRAGFYRANYDGVRRWLSK